jgi:hypothetical protein
MCIIWRYLGTKKKVNSHATQEKCLCGCTWVYITYIYFLDSEICFFHIVVFLKSGCISVTLYHVAVITALLKHIHPPARGVWGLKEHPTALLMLWMSLYHKLLKSPCCTLPCHFEVFPLMPITSVIVYLVHRSVNIFCMGPDIKYFRLCTQKAKNQEY